MKSTISGDVINGLLDMLGLPKEGTIKTRINSIIAKNTNHYSFAKNLTKLSGRSGGLLSAFCPHKVCVGFKVLYQHEGPSDYVQFLRSFKHTPSISIV